MTNLIYFSPRGGTKKYIQAFKSAKEEFLEWDLTYNEPGTIQLKQEELLIIAFPVYYGRVPLLFLQRLEALRGNNTPAIILAVYGNRDFDDALLEMKDFLIKRAFIPYGGAALVAKHSYGHIQTHRPSAEDIKEVEVFIKRALDPCKEAKFYDFPGNVPYKERGKSSFFPSTTDECILCKACVRSCPSSAIDEEIHTIKDKCISCMACLDVCPVDARVLSEEFHDFVKDFSEKIKEPRENVFFL
ncbi:MAG: 4Fe-4S binding protein [Tissierellia bacterium]|nr:4Fe-4S binding protein [Tissierellia bacterium]